jgi:hypothetical protein
VGFGSAVLAAAVSVCSVVDVMIVSPWAVITAHDIDRSAGSEMQEK